MLVTKFQKVRQLEMENARLNMRISESEMVEKNEEENIAGRYEAKIDELRVFMEESMKEQELLKTEVQKTSAERDRIREEVCCSLKSSIVLQRRIIV